MEEFFNIFFGLASIVLGYLSYKKGKDLERFKEFAESLTMIDYSYVDAIMIGPRKSGKTSIAELWTSPWTQIVDIESSAVWQMYERDIYEFKSDVRTNPNISIEQTYEPVLRLRVHDYPGEDIYRVQAIKKLDELSDKAVLVFMFHVVFVNGKIEGYVENSTYFSAQFADMVMERLTSLSGDVAKAIVVFNKADILPDDWSDTKALQELKKVNRDAIYQIERLFSGNLEYHLTSALTNKGLVTLLGSIGLAGLETKRDQKSFKQKIETIKKQIGVITES